MAAQPPWTGWVTADHSQRVGVGSGLVLAVLAAERWLSEAARTGRLVRFAEIFGTSSLAVASATR
jgi:hypothetical protein